MGGGGSSGGGGSAPAIQTQIVREAPGIEERKIGLMDIGLNLASTPVEIPAYQIAGGGQGSALQQQGLQAAGQTGVGQDVVNAGIGSILNAGQGPNINQFLNPYQSYVTDEINRQSQMQQNALAANAVKAGAFGGGRQGIQAAEQERARLNLVGQSQAQGFNTAAALAAQQQQLGIQGGQALGNLGAQQQAMQQADISSLMSAGGIQQQLAQQALDAQRATELQQQYEPYQRLEYLKNIYAAGPTSQSGITSATAPAVNPLAQTIGTGIGAYQVYQNINKPAATTGKV